MGPIMSCEERGRMGMLFQELYFYYCERVAYGLKFFIFLLNLFSICVRMYVLLGRYSSSTVGGLM